MTTSVRDLLSAGSCALPGDDARRETALLLRHVLGVSDAWLITHVDGPIDALHVATFRTLIERRSRGEPVAYLVGTRGFHALELEVSPAVLIPRPETELLVELALQRIPVAVECAVADLGTGSGAVALAIAKARPRARVLATDASEAALTIARRNAVHNAVANVTFAEGDWCEALGEARFDVIVSNPPYIAEHDLHLHKGDLRFEPRAALVSGVDGLDAIRAIVRDAPVHLNPDGWLLFEHGWEQGAAAQALLQQSGWHEVFTARDLEGRERVSGAGAA